MQSVPMGGGMPLAGRRSGGEVAASMQFSSAQTVGTTLDASSASSSSRAAISGLRSGFDATTRADALDAALGGEGGSTYAPSSGGIGRRRVLPTADAATMASTPGVAAVPTAAHVALVASSLPDTTGPTRTVLWSQKGSSETHCVVAHADTPSSRVAQPQSFCAPPAASVQPVLQSTAPAFPLSVDAGSGAAPPQSVAQFSASRAVPAARAEVLGRRGAAL
ncbi:MAG: hypothetical protein EOO41_00075, partial [Methanobacteriota archaeon]